MRITHFLTHFLEGMAGRIFLILLLGIGLTAIVGVSFSDARRISDLRRVQDVRMADRVGDFLRELNQAPATERPTIAEKGIAFLQQVPAPIAGTDKRDVTHLLARRLNDGLSISARNIPIDRCTLPRRMDEPRYPDLDRIWDQTVEPTDCWSISARLQDGSQWHFVTGSPPLLLTSRSLDPTFLTLLAIVAAVLAAVVARMAARPIRDLTHAAAGLDADLDAPLLMERGPRDVRTAARAFNAMQNRLRRFLHEQTHMISAITHDLQTPMTRLRLRIDQVEDDELRTRLLADWAAMREIVDEGLELARSTGGKEDVVQLDVDSMIASIVEDSVEMGHRASFDHMAGQDVRCRPQMLRRCVQNLVDNAIRHGGCAHLSTVATPVGLTIRVRDHGPGIPADQLDAVFEPMVRLDISRSRETGGSGLGLTISRILAQRNGAEIALRNESEGGLSASITFKNSGAI